MKSVWVILHAESAQPMCTSLRANSNEPLVSQIPLIFFKAQGYALFYKGSQMAFLTAEQAPDVELPVQRAGLLVYHLEKLFNMCDASSAKCNVRDI